VARTAAKRPLRLADAMVALSPERWAKWCALSLRLRVEIPDFQKFVTEDEMPRYVLERTRRLVLPFLTRSGAARDLRTLYNEMIEELFAAGTDGRLSGSYYDGTLRRREPITAEHWAGRLEPVKYFGLGTGPEVVGLNQDRPLYFQGNPEIERVDTPVADRIDVEADELRPGPSGLVLPDVLIVLKSASSPEARPPPTTTEPGRKRGRPSVVEKRVEKAMREAYSNSLEALAKMTEESLAAQFRCSRSTAGRVRKRILNRKSEF
jgi:hypothetical protein